MNIEEKMISKAAIAKRYGVCERTITEWMKRKIPYKKFSYKVLRFDPEKCDRALAVYEVNPQAGCKPE